MKVSSLVVGLFTTQISLFTEQDSSITTSEGTSKRRTCSLYILIYTLRIWGSVNFFYLSGKSHPLLVFSMDTYDYRYVQMTEREPQRNTVGEGKRTMGHGIRNVYQYPVEYAQLIRFSKRYYEETEFYTGSKTFSPNHHRLWRLLSNGFLLSQQRVEPGKGCRFRLTSCRKLRQIYS